MGRSLRSRLLLANIVVAGIALATTAIAVVALGPGYFADAMGHAAGVVMGGMAGMMDATTAAAFGDAVRAALLVGAVLALVVAVAVSLALSSAIAGPMASLGRAARRIADGHYAERVEVTGPAEVVDLAASFNAMTTSLEGNEQRRLELVGDVAHELRTPLATLDGYLEGLEDGVVAAAPETWRLLRSETGRLARLVDDLQELWRAESRQLPLRIEPIDVAAIARDVVERQAPLARDRAITIASDGLDARVAATADRDRVSQILSNYLTNAIRYSPSGSTVRVRAQAGPPTVSVVDEGPGLTKEQQERVFDRFYRIDPSRSRALGGSGIGLAIVRALAAAMNGRAWATSDGPGTGATFFVELPPA